MLIIHKNNLIIGIELKYNIKQKFNSLDNFFDFIKKLNFNIIENNIEYTKIETNKKNISLFEIDDNEILNFIDAINNNIENDWNIENNNNDDDNNIIEFNIDDDYKEIKKENIKVEIKKSEEFSNFFWNN